MEELPYTTVDASRMLSHLQCGCLQQQMRSGKYPLYEVISIHKDRIEVECPVCASSVRIHLIIKKGD